MSPVVYCNWLDKGGKIVRLTRIFCIALAVAIVARPARAEMKLAFRDGRVTLVARDVSVRQILTEWAKVGGTQIVNLERVSTVPVTLQLDAVPERQALEVILRSVAGYVAAPRKPEHPGPSRYDRILVMAVSTPPAGAAARPATAPPAFPTPREVMVPTPVPGPLFPAPVDDGDADDDTVLAPRPGLTPGMPGFPTAPAAPGAAQPPRPFTTGPAGTSVPGIVVPVPQSPNQPSSAQPPNTER